MLLRITRPAVVADGGATRQFMPGLTADWRRDGNGNLTLDIMIEQVEGRIARNVGRGEGIAPTLERRYGLNPAAGAYR